MLFHKSLVSFVAAIALASGVTASLAGTEPAGNGQRNTQAVVPSCSAGTPTCCDSTTPFNSLSPSDQAALAALDSNLNKALPVGLHCAASGSQGCYNQALCCDAIQNQDGLPNAAANCVNPK